MLDGKKTYIGIFIMVLGFIAPKLHLNFSTEDTTALTQTISDAVTALGTLIAIYGRAKARV